MQWCQYEPKDEGNLPGKRQYARRDLNAGRPPNQMLIDIMDVQDGCQCDRHSRPLLPDNEEAVHNLKKIMQGGKNKFSISIALKYNYALMDAQ